LAWLGLNILEGGGHISLIIRTGITVIWTYGKTHQFVLLAWCGIVAHFWDQLHIAFMSLNKLKNNFVSFSRWYVQMACIVFSL